MPNLLNNTSFVKCGPLITVYILRVRITILHLTEQNIFESATITFVLHIMTPGNSISYKCARITETCLYNFDPLKPHFYIVKLGFTGVDIIFLISAQKHSLWALVRTASPRRF